MGFYNIVAVLISNRMDYNIVLVLNTHELK